MPINYDRANMQSVEDYARRLLGKSLRSLITNEVAIHIESHKKNKGNVGWIVEKYYFGYAPNNRPEPDFFEANLELKTTPLKKINHKIVAKERLVLNMINYENVFQESWEKSTFLRKNRNLLLMFYLYETDTSVLDLIFKLIGVWKFPIEDLLIIQNDWEKIISKIRDGKAHEISEGDTIYLGACRKGAGGSRDLCKQPKSDVRAYKRAFSLKPKYMNTIIDLWQSKKEYSEYSAIVTDVDVLSRMSFEDYVIHELSRFYDKNIQEIVASLEFNKNSKAKGFYASLTLSMLGVKTRKASEFEKADISIKTVRLDKNNLPEEDISFPHFKYKEIVKENWDNSSIRSELEKRFLFVFFKYNDAGNLEFKKAVFWNMPISDIDREVKQVWQKTKRNISLGLPDKLPKKSESKICHVRPHAATRQDVDELPNGTFFVKKAFWLNNNYIKEQLTMDIT